MDYPKGWAPSLAVVSSYSPKYFHAAAVMQSLGQGPSSTSAALGTGVVFMLPFTMPAPYLIRSFWWANGSTVNGNMDMGIYSWNAFGTTCQKLVSVGSTAQTGTSTLQIATPSSPYLLDRGSYYLAITNSGATGTTWGSTFAASTAATSMMPFITVTSGGMTSSVTIAKAPTTNRYPLCGFSRLASGY